MVFRKVLRQQIQREKNIHVRERHENTIRRNYNIMLVLFLGGGYLLFRNFMTFEQGLFLIAIFLAWYGFLENTHSRYSEYTDELIRLQDKKGKKKK